MNWLSVISFIVPILNMVPEIIHAWESSANNGVGKVADILKSSHLEALLAQMGSQLFPKLSPALHAAAAALVIAHPNNTSWLQSAMNVLKSTGFVDFGADLVVDGIYGPKTFAAVEAVQAKLGVPSNGFVADTEYNAIAALLAKV